MSWLAAHWYSVFAIFAAPAIAGVACWAIAHHVIFKRERQDRAREAKKLGDLQLSRPVRRR